MSQKRAEQPDHLITAAVYEASKARGYPWEAGVFPLVRSRVRQLLQDLKDPAMVELLAQVLAERDKEQFNVTYSLNPRSLDLARLMVDVPDEAWRWALWEYKLPLGRLRDSVGYWLGVWRDALDTDRPENVMRAKKMLDLLWEHHLFDLEPITL